MAGGPLPASITSKLNRMIREFFWTSGNNTGTHLIRWEVLTTPKCEGGLGLRDMATLNKAMLSKTLWKIASGEHCNQPWVQLLAGKYLQRKDIWLVNCARSCTKLWRGLLQSRDMLAPHVVWQLGNGERCPAFGQPWHSFWRKFHPPHAAARNLSVKELLIPLTNQWSTQKLLQLFGFYGALFITCTFPTPPLNPLHQDRLVFTYSQNGKFSFKRIYSLARGQHNPLPSAAQNTLKAIWHYPGILPRIRIFLWKLFHGVVPTRAVLSIRIPNIPPSCAFCDELMESPAHALFHCPLARSFWLSTQLGIRSDQLPQESHLILQRITPMLQGQLFVTFANYLWAFWKNRCAQLYDGKQFRLEGTLHLANSYEALSHVSTPATIPNSLKQTWCSTGTNTTRGDSANTLCWIDGSFHQGSGQGGWACVVKSNHSLLVFAAAQGPSTTPFRTELEGFLLALKVLQEHNITQCLFLTDSCQLDSILNSVQQPDTAPWQDFHAMKEGMLAFRRNARFSSQHIGIDDNLEAHTLANYARVHRTEFREYMYPLVSISMTL